MTRKTSLLLFLFLAAYRTAIAAETLPLSDYQPHLRSGEFYSEQWSASVWSNNSYYVHVQFLISNIGLGDHKGAVKIETTLPDQSRDSRKYRADKNWKSADDIFRLQFAEHTIEQSAGVIKIKAGDAEFGTELTIKPLVSGWKPGIGTQFVKTAEGDYDYFLLVPRAEISGVLRRNGESIAIKGFGFMDHSYSDVAPHKLAKRWLKMKFFTEDGYTLLFVGLASPSSKDDLTNCWLWFGKNEQTLFRSSSVAVKFAAMENDAASNGRYRIPAKIHLRATADGRTFGLDLSKQSLRRHKDMLEGLSSAERFVVERFSKPIDYTFSGSYFIQLDDPASSKSVKVKGRSDYIMQYLNQ